MATGITHIIVEGSFYKEKCRSIQVLRQYTHRNLKTSKFHKK